jgi:anti-sigma B factor antagonist
VMRAVCDVAVLTRNGGSLLCVNGEVNSTTVGPFSKALHAAQGRSPHVTVDLSGVTFMDSIGVKALAFARRRVPDGGRLRVVGATDQVRRSMELCGLAELLLSDSLPLTWRQVTHRGSGWRQWMTEERSANGVPLGEILEVGPWAGYRGDDTHYVLDTFGRTGMYGSLEDAMRAAEDPTAVAQLTKRPSKGKPQLRR